MVYSQALEFFARVALLDVSWLASLFAGNNLVWVFVFLASGYFLISKKRILLGLFICAMAIWVSLDFTRVLGWVLLDARYLLINNIAMIAVLTFVQYDENLKKHLLVISTVRFILLLAIFNLFLR